MRGGPRDGSEDPPGRRPAARAGEVQPASATPCTFALDRFGRAAIAAAVFHRGAAGTLADALDASAQPPGCPGTALGEAAHLIQ